MSELEELRKQPHWSYSALNTYLNVCQVQYYFRYIERAEAEQTSACLPFGRAFHAALTAQAWECVMGSSSTRAEIVERFVEAFEIEVEATPNLIYKDGENRDSMIELAAKMLDVTLAHWSDFYTVKGVAEAFAVEVPGLDKKLIGEYDLIVHDGPDICIVDWKTSASRWPGGKVDRDLQATVFSYAYWRQTDKRPLFRFDVTTKAKTPDCSSHYTVRDRHDFNRFEFIIGQVENAINKGIFLPSETSFACAECPYAKKCRSWHCKVR